MGYAFFIRPEPLVAVRDNHAAECVPRTFERQTLPLALYGIVHSVCRLDVYLAEPGVDHEIYLVLPQLPPTVHNMLYFNYATANLIFIFHGFTTKLKAATV